MLRPTGFVRMLALLVALIALVCVGVITSTGSGVQSIFSDISAELAKANP